MTDFVRLKQEKHEEHQFAEDLRELTGQMEAEIYARSQEVAQANHQLRQAHDELKNLYEKAKEVDEIKSRFFANVSHELRTPLALILGPVEKRLKMTDLAEKERHEMEVVRHNARLLLKHVNNLLDVARVEAGRMTLRYAEADFARLVRFVAYCFESVAEERKIRFTVEAPERMPAQVDPEKCQRILLNLLSNAVKFTEEGGAVSVSLRPDDRRAVIVVQDTGPGIPDEMREAVFERFRQLESGGAHSPGTGLGLAIVKEFVALHGGEVAVEEAPGGGALFRVELPLTAPAGVAVQPEPAAPDQDSAMLEAEGLPARVAPAAETRAAADAPLILLVEDNPEMNDFLTDTLGRVYRVVSAFDGEDGLHKALEIHPDLIVSDVMMPRMSGDQMAAALREHPETEDTPIILVTARADDAFRVSMLKKGVQGYFIKPFAADELMARIGGLIAERRRKEALLRESEERFRTMANAIPQLAWIARPDGYFLWLNQRWYEYTGAVPEQMEGWGWQSVLDPAVLSEALEKWRTAAATGEPFEMESRMRGRDGSYRLFLTRISPLRNRQGEVVQWFGTSTDITELKQTHEILMKANEELERRVAERTKELEETNRELETFNYSVAHDLRTPLTVISGYLEMSQQGCSEIGECRQYLQYAYEGTVTMGQLIEGLLEFSRMSRVELRRETVNLCAKAEEIIADLRVAESERRVTTRIADGVEILGDPSLLRTALANLLGNAWKFTRMREEAVIEFGVTEIEGKTTFFVRDNGDGFEMADADKLFVPFQRLGGAEEFGGHGIGLATVSRIIQRHGGRIWAEGEPGKGATFYFTLANQRE